MLILGSKSPRRKEILKMVNINFKTILKDVPEDIKCDDPKNYPLLTSKKKADALINDYPNDVILCCDTIVYINNLILGKPKSYEDAYNMIKMIQNNTHYVITGVFLGNIHKQLNYDVITKVKVGAMTDEEIKNYISTSEPYDKAGSYAIQGEFAKYIESIDGDYYNVMGLPINSIYNNLKEFKNFL